MAKAKGKASDSKSKIKIQWYRSTIATPKAHKELVRSLGLTKLNQIVERPDTASMRGAVAKAPSSNSRAASAIQSFNSPVSCHKPNSPLLMAWGQRALRNMVRHFSTCYSARRFMPQEPAEMAPMRLQRHEACVDNPGSYRRF